MKSIVNQLPKNYHFDYQYMVSKLKDYSAPRDKIRLMIGNGEIVRIKKGLYILSPDWGGSVDLNSLANVIHGPSYVSLESALSYWGLIPERVTAVTSMTTKRSKRFATPIGNFLYQHMHHEAFITGVMRLDHEGVPCLIASREKALCDRIARAPSADTRLWGARIFADILVFMGFRKNHSALGERY